MAIHRCGAFTLIELMLALALSLGIILLAYTSVRESTRTLTAMQRMATENALLRNGYLAVVDDADFWHSQANPDYPYCKGYMSDETDKLDDGRGIDSEKRFRSNNGGPGDIASNKRMFKPIAFPTALTNPRNPNWQQPHDPRTWYRNYLLPGMIGIGRKAEGQDFDGPATGQVVGDKQGGYDDTGRRSLGQYVATWPTCPDWSAASAALRSAGMPGAFNGIGWHPWHLHGDYTVASNLAMHDAIHADPVDPAKPGSPPTARDREAGSQPTMIWNLFKNLGQLGVIGYTAPGTPNLILRPTTNLASVGDQSLHWDKGEVPWSLGSPGGDQHLTTAAGDADHWPRGAIANPPRQISTGPKLANGQPANPVTNFDNWRGNYADAMFSPGYNVNVIYQSQSFACDFASVIAFDGSPLGLLYATRPALASVIGPKFNWRWQIDNGTIQPFTQFDRDIITNSATHPRGMYDDASPPLSPYDFRSFMYARRWFSNTTFHVPSRHTDDPDPDVTTERQPGLPAMGTTVFRYQLGCDDKVMCSIRVGDDREGRVLELRFAVTSTTFRGARQHWGQRTQANDPGRVLKDVGDVYRDPGNVYP